MQNDQPPPSLPGFHWNSKVALLLIALLAVICTAVAAADHFAAPDKGDVHVRH